MILNELYKKWCSGESIDLISKSPNKVTQETIAEISLYKYIDHPELDAALISTSEITSLLEKFKTDGLSKLMVHYSFYFNAEYDDVLTLIGFIKRRFEGTVYAFSPEEIIFLSIRGNKSFEEVITDLKKEGIENIWGFVPPSIINSNYYSDEDELVIDDRNALLPILIKENISFSYPFNLGAVDFEEEFIDMVNFIRENNIQEIILQPNPLIDTDEVFNYERAQEIFLSLFENGIVLSDTLHSDKNKSRFHGYKYIS